ncbi:uncharacterized protein LOC117950787 [Etheostoma cragini]|uniref:uncharacterized protein LOC117950787 n=1 Tax=Etheostoma cragini TaxID=417921 RepID=UPI00155F518A|nr:uncharacterized protein LOC117950787 [Etheostoma cragini]
MTSHGPEVHLGKEDSKDTILRVVESKLKALQCHFTWDLETSKILLLRRRDYLEDIRPLLRLYINHGSIDEAIALAEEALGAHPDERYLKGCLAYCYKWKIFEESPNQSVIDRAISLHKEVIALYPHSSFAKKINLAKTYAKLKDYQDEAEQIYQELLGRDLEPADKQTLCSIYAKYLFFCRKDSEGSLRYHMEVVKMPLQSIYRKTSIKILEKNRNRSPMGREIEEFLANLQEP